MAAQRAQEALDLPAAGVVAAGGEKSASGPLRRRKPHRAAAATVESRDDWRTPPDFLDGLRERWRFELDAACSVENAVAPFGLTAERDALVESWRPHRGVATHMGWPDFGQAFTRAVWCNPPYGRKGRLARAFVGRAVHQAAEVCGPLGLDVVMLLPGTPGVAWMHDAVLGGDHPASEVWFTRGRLSFVHPETGEAVSNNPVSSTLVVWRAGWRAPGAPLVGSLGRDGRPVGGW